jgi:hypothetical protein
LQFFRSVADCEFVFTKPSVCDSPLVLNLLHRNRARCGNYEKNRFGSEMNFRSCILCAAFFVTLFANSVHAQTRVGEAVVVQNEVVRVGSSATLQINVGDGLLRDEVASTGVASAARLVMADNTNLSLGPTATIKLDRTCSTTSTAIATSPSD